MVTVCPSQFATRRTLFHVLVGCGLLMLKVSRLKLPVIWRSEERRVGKECRSLRLPYHKQNMMLKCGGDDTSIGSISTSTDPSSKLTNCSGKVRKTILADPA